MSHQHHASQVILVDDDDDLRAISKLAMEHFGFAVSDVADGAAAIRLVEHDPDRFDLAFLDFNLPGLNGIQTLRILKQLCPGIRVILCSGTSKWECLRECESEGLLFLEKPFRLSDLESVLAEALSA